MGDIKKNKVILAMTRDSHIYECIMDNINSLGKECVLLNIPPVIEEKNKESLKFKLKLFYKLKIVKNKRYLERFGKNSLENGIINNIKRLSQETEYCLMIRPDIYSEKIIDALVSNIDKTYAYQWDGLDRFPAVLNLIHKFKKFYIYDKKDLGRFDNTSLITNFYFDCYLKYNEKSPKYDVYYIGGFDDRINDIIEVCEKLYNLGLKMKILIHCPVEHRGKLKKYPFITEIYKGVTYKENLFNVFNCKTLLDFGHKKTHTGLSMRPFEALGYSKKLITTNHIIRNYDFYSEENIFVYENSNSKMSSVKSFLNTSYKKMDKNIFEKHSFSNWFKFVTEQV